MAEPAPFPSNESPIAGESGVIQQVWYYLLLTLFNRSGGTGAPLAGIGITVGASPFSYDAELSGTVLVSGGTVSAISIIRDSVTFLTGATAGAIPVMRGDTVTVTHTGAPTMTFLPSEATGA